MKPMKATRCASLARLGIALNAVRNSQARIRRNGLEGVARGIVMQEGTGLQIEVPAVQMDGPGLHAFSNPRIGQQILERNEDPCLLAGSVLQRWQFRR